MPLLQSMRPHFTPIQQLLTKLLFWKVDGIVTVSELNNSKHFQNSSSYNLMTNLISLCHLSVPFPDTL